MWKITDEGLFKEFIFDDFTDAFAFMEKIAEIAKQENHHPRFMNEWNKVSVWLITYSEKTITDKDYKLAKIIDKI